ncbi:hypothetical protein HMPREF1326_02219 [Akkermansia sp. KLE1605]|nr:hypothetical protein HMPREF1326_02219 [Akkermansia sp. KLE1605]
MPKNHFCCRMPPDSCFYSFSIQYIINSNKKCCFLKRLYNRIISPF